MISHIFSVTLFPLRGAHFNPETNYIARQGYSPDSMNAFTHEYAHALYETLPKEQQESIERHFEEHHPEFKKLFQPGEMYGAGFGTFGTEALAFFLSSALTGIKTIRFQKKFHYESGKAGESEIRVTLQEDDVDLFLRLGLITEDMREALTGRLGHKELLFVWESPLLERNASGETKQISKADTPPNHSSSPMEQGAAWMATIGIGLAQKNINALLPTIEPFWHGFFNGNWRRRS